MTTLTGTFDDDHGFVRLHATSVPAGHHLYRLSPWMPDNGRRLPAFDYTSDRADQWAADYLAPLGETVYYGVLSSEWTPDDQAVASVAVTTPQGTAYLRHMFDPRLSMRVRVLAFDDTRPGRQTVWQVSGQANAQVTWDVRAGRDVALQLLLDTPGEKVQLEELLVSGSPVSFAMCAGLGERPGIFAVGDVSFTRVQGKARWVVDLALVEVDMPRILGVLHPDDIPGATYADREQQLGTTGTYEDATAKWAQYYLAEA